MLDVNIGSAKDNMKSAIHNWYKFTAGFSYQFVDLVVEDMAKVASEDAASKVKQNLVEYLEKGIVK